MWPIGVSVFLMCLSWMVIEMLWWCGECQLKWWVTVECVSTAAQWRLHLYRARLDAGRGGGVTARGAGGDGWEQGERRTRHEIEWEWRTEKSWPAQGGGRRQWDRDGETESGERMRVRERLTYSENCWCLRLCAVLWFKFAFYSDNIRWVYEVSILPQLSEGQHVNKKDTGRAKTSE